MTAELSAMTADPAYGLAPPGSLPTRIAKHQRRRMLARFLRATKIAPQDSILDVGVTSDRSHSHSNYLEAWYPHRERITATGVEDAAFLEQEFPGVRFVRADGLRLPFGDASFDFVHASAVIEHVGSRERQAAFLRELWRVARKGLFVTTPDRWFPIEVHTVLPLLHYLPPPLFRRILTALGREFFADEANLNLLSRRSLAAAARAAAIERFRIESVALLGWPSNLLLIANKGDQG
jgi:methyltransferase family protein